MKAVPGAPLAGAGIKLFRKRMTPGIPVVTIELHWFHNLFDLPSQATRGLRSSPFA